MDYLCFKEAWDQAKNGGLKKELYLKNALWRSIFTEEEIGRVLDLIVAFYESKTFADFLRISEWQIEDFARVFDRDIFEVQNWMRRESKFPENLKKTYAFMILTNHIAFYRQRMCMRCEELFLSADDEIYCDQCREIIKKEQQSREGKNEPETIKLQIELICKNS